MFSGPKLAQAASRFLSFCVCSWSLLLLNLRAPQEVLHGLGVVPERVAVYIEWVSKTKFTSLTGTHWEAAGFISDTDNAGHYGMLIS